MRKNKLLLLLALLMTAATGAWADETPKVVFEEHFVSEPTDPTAVGFYEFINFEEGDDHEVDNGELSIFNSDGTLDINNWKRRAIKFRNLPLGEGKTYRLEFKLKGSTRFEDGINDGDDRPFCKASAQLLQGVEGHDISLLDSDGKEQRGEFENFDESNYKSYSMTFVFASEQKQKDTYALNNQGELAEKYYLSLSIFNPGYFYLKDVVLYEIPSASSGYTVSLKDGVKDADKWTISPNPAEEGQTVTLQYTGRLKVKGVTATSDAPAEAKPAAMVTLPLGEMTQGGDPLNNGSGSETYSSPTFKEGDQIALVHGGVKDVVTVGKPNPDGSAPITGDITVGADNEDIVLVYPADLVDVAVGGTAYTENTDVTNKFNSQAGTLAYIQNNLDIRKGTGKLAVSGASASLKANVSMTSQIAIWKLTMKDDYNDDIDAQKVTVKVGGKTVAYASTTSPYFSPNIVYLALNPATMGTGILRIEAEGLGDTYYIEKSGVSLTAGKFYQSTLNMSEE